MIGKEVNTSVVLLGKKPTTADQILIEAPGSVVVSLLISIRMFIDITLYAQSAGLNLFSFLRRIQENRKNLYIADAMAHLLKDV